MASSGGAVGSVAVAKEEEEEEEEFDFDCMSEEDDKPSVATATTSATTATTATTHTTEEKEEDAANEDDDDGSEDLADYEMPEIEAGEMEKIEDPLANEGRRKRAHPKVDYVALEAQLKKEEEEMRKKMKKELSVCSTNTQIICIFDVFLEFWFFQLRFLLSPARGRLCLPRRLFLRRHVSFALYWIHLPEHVIQPFFGHVLREVKTHYLIITASRSGNRCNELGYIFVADFSKGAKGNLVLRNLLVIIAHLKCVDISLSRPFLKKSIYCLTSLDIE